MTWAVKRETERSRSHVEGVCKRHVRGVASWIGEVEQHFQFQMHKSIAAPLWTKAS